jgi:hypothetical protein
MKFKVYSDMYNYLKEYYEITGSVNMDVRSIILDELRSGPGINPDEGISWTSPGNEYYFKITRNEVSLADSYYYSIVVDIYDGITKYPLLQLKFDQETCINILFQFALSFNQMNNPDDQNIAYINCDNQMNGYMIILTNIFGYNPIEEIESSSPIHDLDNDNEQYFNKDVLLQIVQRSYVYDNIIPLISMKLRYEELSLFAFKIFFEAIIDLEFPEEYEDKMQYIEEFLLVH